jgi:hypothetical protein
MLLTELVKFLIDYQEIKELRTEMKAIRQMMAQAHRAASSLPCLGTLREANLITPYAFELLQAGRAVSYKVAKALDTP